MSNNMSAFLRHLVSFAGAQTTAYAVMLAMFCGAPPTSSYDASLGSYLSVAFLAALFFAVPVVLLRAFDASVRMTTGIVGGLLGVAACSLISTLPAGPEPDHALAACIAGLLLIALMVGIVRLTVYGSDLVLRKYDNRIER
ncbi:MAG: hypothetical protein KGS72_13675 [Cyanobacteria bacterium REEB67]|nr:hypothetical protein [Cyanobacteria bacterium REEB67]